MLSFLKHEQTSLPPPQLLENDPGCFPQGHTFISIQLPCSPSPHKFCGFVELATQFYSLWGHLLQHQSDGSRKLTSLGGSSEPDFSRRSSAILGDRIGLSVDAGTAEPLSQSFRTVSRRACCNMHLAPLAYRARYKSKPQKLVTQESPKMKVPRLFGLQSGTDPKLSLSHSAG